MIYYYDQQNYKIRLLQTKKAKLSTIISNEGIIKSIINCSFFTSGYVIGRNQGDTYNDTVDLTNFEGNSIVIFKDNGYKIGYYNSWDYQNDVVAGFSPCAIFRNGQLEIAPSLKDKWNPNSVINRTAICYNDSGFHFIVATNINYQDLADNIWEKYKPHFIAFLDSGGSSEIIIDKKLQFIPSDKQERLMFNGLAFVEIEEPTTDKHKAKFPTHSTWVSQGMNGAVSHKGTKAIDFGTWSQNSLKRLGLPSDYDYPLYAPFDCKVVYADSVYKGGTIALESLDKVELANGEVDYLTIISEHSNDRPPLNTIFKQGDLYAHFGTAGGVNKHWHLEVIKGRFSEIYKDKNIGVIYQQGIKANVYAFESTIEPNKALYLSESDYIEDNPYQWKILKESSEIEELRKENKELKETIETKNKALKNIGEIVNGNL